MTSRTAAVATTRRPSTGSSSIARIVARGSAQTRQFDLGQPLAGRQFTGAEMRKALGR